MDLLNVRIPPADVVARTGAIGEALLGRSGNLSQPNFQSIGADDLARLFGLYDAAFFGGVLDRQVRAQTALPPAFRLSSTMTRSGGRTSLYRRRAPDGTVQTRYEIAVASRMLFMSFGDAARPVIICGLACPDRLAALQRIMEHEIVHLVELLAFGRSSCSAARFRALAGNIFAHTGTTHGLVTPREHAAVRHGIHVGDLVDFQFQGRRLTGRVNRLNRRATVLVADADGRPYSDGRRYSKYYVPLDWLRRVDAGDAGRGATPPV